MTLLLRITQYAVLLFLAGCSSLTPLLSTPTPAPVLTAASTPPPQPTPTATRSLESRTLRVWLPPRFDPNVDTPSANLLKQRLADFEDEYGVRIEVRIKAETGDNDLVNSLAVTGKAAPSAMPDLIALTHSDMEDAAVNGLLHPIDGLTTILHDPDWYAFAREMGHVQSSGFGVPFAADAMGIVYRPAVFQGIPSGWTSILESGNQLVYPASDSKSYLSLSLYLSINNQLVDTQGGLVLDETTLTRVLSFHKQALETGVVPPIVKDFQTDGQSMPMFYSGEAGANVIWLSNDLALKSGHYVPVFGLDDTPYSLADGWLWAFAGSDTVKQPLAVELASYLVDSEYMSSWTKASGYLPTRPQALNGWEDAELNGEINEILQSSYPVPSDDVLAVLSPIMEGAVIRVFNGEQPEAVARSVIEGLK